MKRITLSLALGLISFVGGISAYSDDVAAPLQNITTTPVAAEVQAPLDSLDFASGEISAFNATSGVLDVKVYLDVAGDAKERTVSLNVDQTTEITDGEADLKADSLKPNAEIDVEYDTTNNKATYIYIY